MDTLEIAHRLCSAGFSAAPSDAMIDALREVVDGEVAIKTDPARLQGKLSQDMARLKPSFQGLRTEFARTEGRVDRRQWILGVGIALSVAILVELLLT